MKQIVLANHAFRFGYDYTWVMMAINEGLVDDYDGFRSPQAFLDYLYEIGIEGLPTRFTLFRAYSKTLDSYPNWTFLDMDDASESLRRIKYPNWTFLDMDDASESLRRINVVKQFLSAFGKAKRADCNKNCNK